MPGPGSWLTSKGYLPSVWAENYLATYGKTPPALSLKERMMLKEFVKYCPEGRAAEILAWIIRNWIEFVAAAKTEAPAYPEVKFLMAFPNVAFGCFQVAEKAERAELAWLKREVKSKAAKAAKEAELEAAKKAKPIPKMGDADYVPATKEELLAILKG